MNLTDYIKIRDLILHGVRVYLAHIKSTVALSYVFDVQSPHPLVRVRYLHSVIFRHYKRLYRQYRLCVHSQPGNLQQHKIDSIIVYTYIDLNVNSNNNFVFGQPPHPLGFNLRGFFKHLTLFFFHKKTFVTKCSRMNYFYQVLQITKQVNIFKFYSSIEHYENLMYQIISKVECK